MAVENITRHITTKGNLPHLDVGTPVYVASGDDIVPNLQVGQLVYFLEDRFDPFQVAINPDDIKASDVHRLRVGVGHAKAPRKNGIADSIRFLGVEKAGNCDMEHASTASPRCGSPKVVDAYFDCTNCDETYSIAVGVDDNFTRSFAPSMRSFADWIGAYKPNCKTCEGCDTDVTCDDVVKGLIKSVYSKEAPLIDGKPYPDYSHPELDPPFHLTQVFSRDIRYCLSFTAPGSDCEICDRVSAITEVTIGGVAYTLTGTVLPEDNTQTGRLQLFRIVDQINALFAEHLPGEGSAYVSGVDTGDSCCPLNLYVNTSDATFAITGLAITAENDPFAVGGPGEGFTCGIRAISGPVVNECGPYVERDQLFNGANIRIEQRSDGFQGFQDFKSVTVQELALPGMYGTQVQNQEIYQTPGGSGRNYSRGYQGGKWLGQPRNDSRFVQAPVAECDTDYCQYHIRTKQYFINAGSNQDNFYRIGSYINVPSGDTVTQASVELLLTTWADLSVNCQDVPTVGCTPLGQSC